MSKVHRDNGAGQGAAVPALRHVLPIAFALSAILFALGHIGRGTRAEIWDDALFFRRVAYNILHHGFAGWNLQDGPVFLSTSQLYQAITTALLALAPNHFNASTVLWSAACVAATFLILRQLLRREEGAESAASVALLFALLQAPPIALAITTGMDTCTVFVVMALLLRVALAPPSRGQPMALAAVNVLTYLARPDAVVLSMGVSIGVLSGLGEGRSRRTLQFCLVTAAALLLLSAGFHAYYRTALPLATYLKVSPLSVYDSAYIALGRGGKITNLAEVGLLLIPLVPMIAMRLDRVNVSLVLSGLAFIAFHGLTTNEIMGYHARFYAPALPLLMFAALRGIARADSPSKRLLILVVGLGAAALLLVAFPRAWIENATRGCYLDWVPFGQYAVYFVGVVAVASLLWLPEGARRIGAAVLAVIALASIGARTFPAGFTVASDADIYDRTAANDGDLVGLDTIRRCFEEPIQLAHSELGTPGVLLPESRIIDYTGLANPSVVNRRFDFEKVCVEDRPEFIFRPHWSHQRLNEQLSASRCLSSGYTLVPLSRPSSCPLFVRNDLVDRFNACTAGKLAL